MDCSAGGNSTLVGLRISSSYPRLIRNPEGKAKARRGERVGSARAARGPLRLGVATQTLMGTRGSNGMAKEFISGITGD